MLAAKRPQNWAVVVVKDGQRIVGWDIFPMFGTFDRDEAWRIMNTHVFSHHWKTGWWFCLWEKPRILAWPIVGGARWNEIVQ